MPFTSSTASAHLQLQNFSSSSQRGAGSESQGPAIGAELKALGVWNWRNEGEMRWVPVSDSFWMPMPRDALIQIKVTQEMHNDQGKIYAWPHFQQPNSHHDLGPLADCFAA